MNLRHRPFHLLLKPLLLVVLLACSIAQAQEVPAQRLSLEDAIRIAMKRNLELISSRLEVQRSDSRVLEAWGNALPAVDLSGQYVHLVDKPVTFFPDFFLYSFLKGIDSTIPTQRPVFLVNPCKNPSTFINRLAVSALFSVENINFSHHSHFNI